MKVVRLTFTKQQHATRAHFRYKHTTLITHA